MTLPPDDEVRDEPAGRRLDAWVEWLAFSREVWRNPISNEWRLGKDRRNDVGMIRHYSTDTSACAELRRRLWEGGKYVEAMVATYYGTANGSDGVSVRLDEMVGANQHYHREPIGTDPIAAECCAWAKVAILAKIAETTDATT